MHSSASAGPCHGKFLVNQHGLCSTLSDFCCLQQSVAVVCMSCTLAEQHPRDCHFLQDSGLEGKWRFSKTWKQTHLKASIPGYTPPNTKPLHVDGFYSDLLYQPWHCANIPLSAKWLKRDTIDRRADLTIEEFRQLYEEPNRPVILQGAVSTQPLAKQCIDPVNMVDLTPHLQHCRRLVCKTPCCVCTCTGVAHQILSQGLCWLMTHVHTSCRLL